MAHLSKMATKRWLKEKHEKYLEMDTKNKTKGSVEEVEGGLKVDSKGDAKIFAWRAIIKKKDHTAQYIYSE